MAGKQVLFTIFGATGDLASRKLYPSLFRLYKKGELVDHFAVIGTARRPWTDEYYQGVVLAAIKELITDRTAAEEFVSHFYYQSHDVGDAAHYATLKDLGSQLRDKYQTAGNQVFFLAMAPQFFGTIAEHLKSEEILTGEGFERLVIEKPFGTSLATARALNDELKQAFTEDQTFRIDHYLGKEMIQSVSAVRFANQMLAAVWNNKYIDDVQITFAEAIGVEGRGGYYDTSGALKDMVQNHLLQVLSLIAMEEPESFDEAHIVAEKVRALQAIRKYTEAEAGANFVRAQYAAGQMDGEDFVGYRDEESVASDSRTETFVAGKFLIDNERWAGVPFYVRTGKRLTEKGTRINIVFKQSACQLFGAGDAIKPNVLTIYIQPTEGFSLTLNGKKAGNGFDIEPARLSFRNDATALANSPEAYERLLLDVLNGDGTNFSHWSEASRAWELIDVIEAAWAADGGALPAYRSGTMGPVEAFELLRRDGHEWYWKPDEWYVKRGLLVKGEE